MYPPYRNPGDVDWFLGLQDLTEAANRPLDVTKMLNFGKANRKLKLFPIINTPDLLTGTFRGLGRRKGS